MKELRRRAPKPVLLLEALDERIAPSIIGPAAVAAKAAVADHSTFHAKARHRAAHRLHHRAALLAPGGPVAGTISYSATVPTAAPTPAPVHTPVASHSNNPAGSLLAASPTLNLSTLSSTPTSTTPTTTSPGSTLPSGESPLPTTTPTATPTATPTVTPTTTPTAAAAADVGDVKNGPLAKAGEPLIRILQASQSGASLANQATMFEIKGSNVGVAVHSTDGNMAALTSMLTQQGMQVRTTNAITGTVEGLLPIASIAAVAQDSHVLSMNALPVPLLK